MNGVITRVWRARPRRIRRRMRTFFQEFIRTEASSGILLMACTLLALLWANSPLAGLYHALWGVHFVIGIDALMLDEILLHWINDGLMAIFFLVVGLEIKREILMGELSSIRRAMLPAAAAIGGMIAPALIFAAVLRGGEGTHGWGIPMATDIAFSLGVLMLLGTRAPLPLKIFLTGLAIVDDLGAVLVIALFYSHELNITALLIGAGILLVLIAMNRLRVHHPTPYVLVGVALWLAVFESGIHATIAGVLLALTVPARVPVNTRNFVRRTQRALDMIEAADPPSEDVDISDDQQQFAVLELDLATEAIESPLHRLEHALHRFVSYGILPLFALANAGVSLRGDAIGALRQPIALGILLGLVFGKPLGISAFSWLAVKLGMAELPPGMRWRHLAGGSVLAGIGFTMSIFIATLAFSDPQRLEIAKIAIISASLIAGLAGFLLLRLMALSPYEQEQGDQQSASS
jgi:Na+:H+ antiporter, NhaA family